MPCIKIGDGAIVGSGSIVTKDVPENNMVAGNPNKLKKMHNTQRSSWEKV